MIDEHFTVQVDVSSRQEVGNGEMMLRHLSPSHEISNKGSMRVICHLLGGSDHTSTDLRMTDEEMIPVEFDRLLDEVDRECKRLADEIPEEVNAQPTPKVIWHYTDDRGLSGILETGTLWITDIFDLNDPSELRHGLSYGVNYLNKIAQSWGITELSYVAKVFSELHASGVRETMNFFTLCFSLDGDELGQWRAYADDGRGYALGFDGDILEALFLALSPGSHHTFPVIYDDALAESQQKALVDVVSLVFSDPKFAGLSIQQKKKVMIRASNIFSSNIILTAALFKHQAYTNEKEYRFLEAAHTKQPVSIKHRKRPYSLVRYRELDWQQHRDALKFIRIGPAAGPERMKEFAEDCVREFLVAESGV